MCPYPKGRSVLPIGLSILFISLFSAASATAQVCQSSFDLGFTNLSGNINASANCVGLFRCYSPTVNDVEWTAIVRPAASVQTLS